MKHCKMCGQMISDLDSPDTDYYRHLPLKYCDTCRQTAERTQAAARMQRLRERKRQKDKYRDEQLELLKEENELLRKRVQQLREEATRSNRKGRMPDEIKKADETYRI